MLCGWGWAELWTLSFSTMLKETTSAQLPPLMINKHTLPWTVYREWKMFSYCSSLVLRQVKVLLMTNISPSSASSTISLESSSCSSIKQTSFSSSISSSLTASYLAKVITFLFGQSVAMWPSRWHLKHPLVLMGLGLGCFVRLGFSMDLGFFVGDKGQCC